MLKKVNLVMAALILFSSTVFTQNIFVSTMGDDNNTGIIDQPLKTITSAVNKIQSGDTIFVRGGVYLLNATITISKNGNDTSKYYLFAFPGERPLLDFSSMTFSSSNRGINFKASYWHVKGFDIKGAGDNGMNLSGSYNIIEFCSFYENRDTGLQLSGGASNNQIINCDSYFNADPTDYRDADGFAPKLDVGTNNYFYGCRAWGNCDDGWDGYMESADDVTTTLENCWTFKNGYLKDGTDPGPNANGNGFKMGGSDTKTLMHNFILINCLAFDNKSKGFDQNSNKGSMTLYNCTGYRNGRNYSISTTLNNGKTAIVKNCAALGVTDSLGSFVVQQTNSWRSPFSVSESDFISIDTAGVRGARKTNGSLPDITFMHLAPGSDLIDAGTNVGLPFKGTTPDLGAFEFDVTSSLNETDEILPGEFSLFQNYPNPFNPVTKIEYALPKDSKVKLEVFDVLGRKVTTLIDEFKSAGHYSVNFDASGLSSGLYIYRLYAPDILITKKMLLAK